jgi:glutamine amidotransferase
VSEIAIIDYGMGNIGSVANSLARLGATARICSNPAELSRAAAYILPGVGAFHAAMDNLRERKLDRALTDEVVGRQKPFLGICLGMQLLAQDSVELGLSSGLGWIDGHVLKLEPADHRPVPHVGWNDVRSRAAHPLFERVEEGANFFFDHSFHLQCPAGLVVATAGYGGDWTAAVQHGNILGVQFHPEKSQRNGLRLLRNFLRFAETRAA